MRNATAKGVSKWLMGGCESGVYVLVDRGEEAPAVAESNFGSMRTWSSRPTEWPIERHVVRCTRPVPCVITRMMRAGRPDPEVRQTGLDKCCIAWSCVPLDPHPKETLNCHFHRGVRVAEGHRLRGGAERTKNSQVHGHILIAFLADLDCRSYRFAIHEYLDSVAQVAARNLPLRVPDIHTTIRKGTS